MRGPVPSCLASPGLSREFAQRLPWWERTARCGKRSGKRSRDWEGLCSAGTCLETETGRLQRASQRRGYGSGRREGRRGPQRPRRRPQRVTAASEWPKKMSSAVSASTFGCAVKRCFSAPPKPYLSHGPATLEPTEYSEYPSSCQLKRMGFAMTPPLEAVPLDLCHIFRDCPHRHQDCPHRHRDWQSPSMCLQHACVDFVRVVPLVQRCTQRPRTALPQGPHHAARRGTCPLSAPICARRGAAHAAPRRTLHG